jgi:hypothetical protein
VKTKLDHRSPARDLYCSHWFELARRYAETHAEHWFILSAAYGLVRPDTVIDPYERSLNGMKIEARRGWARLVTFGFGSHRFTGFRLYATEKSTSSLASAVATSAGKASAYASI